jgi:hypothetical protein
VGGAEHLAGREAVVGRAARLAVGGRRDGERGLLEHDQAVDLLHVVVRTEAERIDLALRRRVHPAALVARERPLLVVRRDDVLAQLRPDRLEQVPEVPDDREIAQDRVAALAQVVRGEAGESGAGQGGGAAAEAVVGRWHLILVLPRLALIDAPAGYGGP